MSYDKSFEEMSDNELIDIKNHQHNFVDSKLDQDGKLRLNELLEVERELSLREGQ